MTTPQDPSQPSGGWGETSPGAGGDRPDLRKQPSSGDEQTRLAPPIGSPGSVPPPYGAPAPAGPPPAWGGAPHGAPSAYGTGPAYGAPASTNPYGIPDARPRRPATVVVAAVLTFLFSGGYAILFLIGGLLALFGAAVLVGSDNGTELDGLGDGLGAAVGVIGVLLLALAVLSIVAVVLAAYCLRGSSGARIGLTVLATLAALGCLLGVVGFFVEPDVDPASALLTLASLAATVGTVVLLFAGGANAWFAAGGGRNQALSTTPGYGQPGPYGQPGLYGPPGSQGRPWS